MNDEYFDDEWDGIVYELAPQSPDRGVKNTGRGEAKRNPCKKEPQAYKVPKVRQKFCRPSRGFNMLVYPMQGFRYAPPPACVLSPLSGLQFVHASYAGVSLRSTTCL